MLIVSTLIYILLSSIIIIRFFGVLSLNKMIITFFICTVSCNIIIVEILSLFRLLSLSQLYMLVQVIICGAVILILIDPGQKIFSQRLPAIRFHIVKIQGIEIVVVFLISLILSGYLYIGSLIPINNSDSLHTHLPRIYYWLQHGSLESWYTVTETQINYPINTSVQGLWLFLLGRSENLFFLVQWYSLLVAIVLTFEISALLGATPNQSLIACLVMLSFPVVLLQTYSFQGDLFVAVILLCSVYFVMLSVSLRSIQYYFLSTLPLAVSLGVKQTAFLSLPVFFLVIFQLLYMKKIQIQVALIILGYLILFFGFFSSYKFIQNISDEYVSNESMFSSTVIGNPAIIEKASAKGYFTNAMRYFYQSVSLDGLSGKFYLNALKQKNDAFYALSCLLGLDIEAPQYLPEGELVSLRFSDPPALNEDSSWFGPLSYPLFIISMIITILGRDKLRKNYLFFAILLFILFIISLLVLKDGWGPNRGRYFIIPVLIILPLVSFVIPTRKQIAIIIAILLSIISAYLAFSVLLVNDSRLVVDRRSLYKFQANKVEKIEVTNIFNSLYRKRLYEIADDWISTTPPRKSILVGSYYENLFYQNAYQIPVIIFINNYIASTEPIYLLIEKSTLEYALFGKNRTRNLYPVKYLDQVKPGAYVLVTKKLLPETNQGFELVASDDQYMILFNSP